MNPVIMGLLIFICIFILFIIRCVQEAKDKYEQDHEPGNIMKKYYDDEDKIKRN